MWRHENISTLQHRPAAQPPVRSAIAIAQALADESRLRALHALSGHELCVCQIVALLGLAPSTVSKHMAILTQAGLVQSRKDGRWVFYRVVLEGKDPSAQRAALAWALGAIGGDADLDQDRDRLRKILKCDLKKLCDGQRGKVRAEKSEVQRRSG